MDMSMVRMLCSPLHGWFLKGKLRSEKSYARMKERERCKKRVLTDLNAPNGSGDIPFQSQKFEQDGRRRIVGF